MKSKLVSLTAEIFYETLQDQFFVVLKLIFDNLTLSESDCKDYRLDYRVWSSEQGQLRKKASLRAAVAIIQSGIFEINA